MKNKTYHIITIGCQMNKSDSERIAGYLERRNFIASSNPNKSDLVVFTTCGVRQSAEDRVYGLMPKIKRANKKAKIIITGCLSERQDVRRRLKDEVDVWLPITELNSLAEKLGLKETKFPIGNLVSGVSSGGSLGGYLNIAPKHKSRFSAFVPIGNGCDNFCSYCVVPYARGREVYRPAEEIVSEVRGLVKRGYKEIILIAQNVNSYKYNANAANSMRMPQIANYANKKNIGFPGLLRMVNDISGDFWVRFATSHPKDMSDELIEAIEKCDKACEHIHLPAQSGDDDILRRMNRKYTRKNYIDLIKKIRKQIAANKTHSPYGEPVLSLSKEEGWGEVWQPPMSITTDIIVGFPGEVKKQFNNTVKLFEKVKFDMAYIAQYSPRPDTVSFKMRDNVPRAEKKRREKILTKILRKTALENNKEYIGKVVEVLVEGKNKGGEWLGKTRTNKQVRIKNYPLRQSECEASELRIKNLINSFVMVKINKVQDFGLEGKIINQNL